MHLLVLTMTPIREVRPASVTNGKAVASLVFGAVALFVPIPFVLGIIAIVLGNTARREIAADPRQEGDGLAIAGIILGWVDVVMSAILLLVFGFILTTVLVVGLLA